MINYKKMYIEDFNSLDSKETFDNVVNLAKESQKEINAFVTILDSIEYSSSNSLLDKVPYALKDNFSTKGILTTASSNILKDYVPVYDSTVYKKLKEAGAILIGKTSLDELAMGGSGTTGHTGTVKNPWDLKRLIGGSSAGSAAVVAAGIVPFSVGSDTGDSIRKPAAYGGVVGFKPTYGRISRYGLFAFASSLDHVGCFARSVKDVAIVTDVLKGYDEKDMTSLEDENINYIDHLNDDISSKKLFYFKEIVDKRNYENSDLELKEILIKFEETIKLLKSNGFAVEGVDFPKELLSALYPTYMTISCAEATSNNSNLSGIIFGPRGEGKSIDELIFNTRTKGFSELIKRRFVLGSYILQRENQEKLFLNAGRIRRLIVEKMNKLFEEYDGLIMPTSGGISPLPNNDIDKLSDKYLILENHLVIGNFGGYPSISFPNGFVNKLPISINLTGPQFKDCLVLNMANKIEELFPYKGLVVGDENV
jgi:aspartyl-tRNA(Asn)/glutamyl-tRNA(Gln) amidotransferase subunit A